MAPIGVLLAIFALLYTLNFSDRSFWSENEAYYSLGARSVLEGHLLVPLINSDLPADKPPLMFWWVAAVSLLAGGEVHEWVARLANILASLGALAVLYTVGRRSIGRWAALLAVLVLGTSYEYWETSTGVGTDMPLVFFLAASWGAMYLLFEEPFRWRRWAVLWGAMGLALLAKGPVALVLSGLIAPVYCLWRFGPRGAWRGLMRLRPFSGSAAAVAPFLAWMAAVWTSYGAEPLRVILLKHNLERFVDAFDHQKPWYYYLTELPVNFLPWSLLVPVAVWVGARRMRQAGKRPEPAPNMLVFAFCVAGTVFLFFSFSTSKRDYYLLPLMPWIALPVGHWIWARLNSAITAGTGIEPTLCEFRRIVTGSKCGRGLLAATTAIFAGMALYGAFATEWLDIRKSPEPFADEVSRHVTADERLIIVDDEDPRVWYYLEDRFTLEDDSPEGLQRIGDLISTGANVDLLVDDGDLDDFEAIDARTPLFVEAVLTYRQKPVWLLTNVREGTMHPYSGARGTRRSDG